MVGAVNNGWKVITDALAAERVMIGAIRMAGIERAFDHLTEYLKTAVVGGKALRNDPVIRDRLESACKSQLCPLCSDRYQRW